MKYKTNINNKKIHNLKYTKFLTYYKDQILNILKES